MIAKPIPIPCFKATASFKIKNASKIAIIG